MLCEYDIFMLDSYLHYKYNIFSMEFPNSSFDKRLGNIANKRKERLKTDLLRLHGIKVFLNDNDKKFIEY
jgi:hypothetical protein